MNAVSAPAQPGGAAPPKPRPTRRVLTSLAFQIFIYFGVWWDVIYYVINIMVFVYKGLQLPYPQVNFDVEFALAWLWFLIEIPRLFLASKGNKTERATPIFLSFVLALPLLALFVYYLQFQTYVLQIDVIWNAISIAFIGIQYIFGFWAAFRFIMATRFT